MKKSQYVLAVDEIQKALAPVFKDRGFKVRGRTFNRVTDDGLTQVVNIQMGNSDPPGTTYVPGLTSNMYGLFTINLGVYVPEVHRYHVGGSPQSWIHEYNCCVRSRLGGLAGEGKDIWWHARADKNDIDGIGQRFENDGFPFLDRFATRDQILTIWHGKSTADYAYTPPLIVLAIILHERGDRERARKLLSRQASESKESHPGHAQYVQELAETLGLGRLNGLA